MRRRRDLLRRYPSLAFVALAVALAATLPSALNLPTSGPSELAELAPVPPDDEGVPPQQGDLSALGAAGSEGLGAGPGDGAPPPPPPPPGPASGPEQTTPSLKRCVGDPPRQTEDPLSPSCVAFFDGDNGGATARGVTGDRIVLALVVHQSYSGHETWVNYSGPDDPADTGQFDPVLRYYGRYFNDRYQTWGRAVELWGYPVGSPAPEEVEAVATAVEEGPPGVGPPFGAIIALNNQARTEPQLVAAIARRGLLLGTWAGLSRAEHQGSAPYLLSFQPDLEDQAAIAATYLCAKLAGRPPAHAGAATATGDERVFGLYVSDSPTGAGYRHLAQVFRQEVAATPGCDPELHESSVADNPQHSTALASLRAEGVTTIVPFLENTLRGQFTHVVAGQAGWEPEIFFPGSAGWDDRNVAFAAYNQAAWSHAFGITFDRRRDELSRQPHVVALREQCPPCSAPASSDRIYDTMALVFRAIQAAGPELTPQRAEQGLRSIPAHPAPSPYAPAAYFTPGNYSFVKDAMEIWWDPGGQAPGRPQPDGCYRITDVERRHRAGEWSRDDDVFGDRASQPCQGPQGPGANG